MAWEIERKARVRDPELLSKQLNERYGDPQCNRKFDHYFSRSEGGEDRFRLRVLDAESSDEEPGVVTWKTRQMDCGMEINEEHEFGVSNAAEFSGLLARLGCRTFAKKKKETRAWSMEQGLLAELSYVDTLGWFLEIEAVIADESGIEQAKRRVEQAFAGLGVAPEDYEPRPYLSMLASGGL